MTVKERNTLHLFIDDDRRSGNRAKILLKDDDGYAVCTRKFEE
jgi:hypothetical protein